MTDQQQLARGKNMMLTLLEKRLSVPRIYIDAPWQGKSLDLLAIDRDGSGDVHAVLAYVRPMMEELPNTIADKREIEGCLARFPDINAQFKYILGVAPSLRWRVFGDHPASEFQDATFSPDGLGRVGIVWAAPTQENGMTIDIAIYPERFRAFVGASAEEFVRKTSADWELRA